MKIPTKDAQGQPNGYVVTIWNTNEQPELRPDQVYMTAIAPHSQKGPHLHKVRRGLFCCVKGNVTIVTRQEKRLVGGGPLEFVHFTQWCGEDYGYPVVCVDPGVPACIYNVGDTEALVLNMPSPAWSKDNQDEHPVSDWTYDLVMEPASGRY